MIKKADVLGEDLSIIALGPLTNIASAILADHDFSKKINRLIIMGGAYQLTPHGYGNITPVAEFNIWQDPEAAKIVFDSNIDIAAVGLDITNDPKNRLTLETMNKIHDMDSKIAEIVFDLCHNIVERYDGIHLHDPIATIFAIKPSIFHTKRYNVMVETSGELTRGMTVIDRRLKHRNKMEGEVDIAVDIDGEEFKYQFLSRVIGGI
jgi:inosine-uridine nucleoside N-ribohydrolase